MFQIQNGKIQNEEKWKSFLLAHDGEWFELEILEDPQSKAQFNAIHVYCNLLAQALNDAGWDMRKVLKPTFFLPWTKWSVKEYLWKPILEAISGKKSTKKHSKKDVSLTYETLNRELGEKTGVQVDFPTKEYDCTTTSSEPDYITYDALSGSYSVASQDRRI